MSMYPRTNYEMTQEDLSELLDSMQPQPLIMLNIGGGRSAQERANDAWRRLGDKMNFDHMSVRPNGKGDRFFSAIPSETEDQKSRRIAAEKEEEQKNKIAKLQAEINERQEALTKLLSHD